MNVIVRRLGRLDPETLERLVRHERESFKEGGFSQWELPMFSEHGALYVLEVDGETAGAAQLVRDWSDPATVYLAGMSVSPAWRKQGLGKRFLADLLSQLREDDVRAITLTVDPGNEAARRLYSQAGFVDVDTHPDRYGRGEDRLVMRLSLEDGA